MQNRTLSKRLFKPLIIVGAVVSLAFLFYRSVQDTRAEPYMISRAHLQNWTVAAEPAYAPNSPILQLRTQPELARDLFRQIFRRAAESLNAPGTPHIALLLQDEFNRAFAGRVTASDLLAVAREAGLESAVFEPRCLAYRRESAPGVTRQLYFVIFDAPAFADFRQRIAKLTGPESVFDPNTLSPVLFIANADANFNGWLPLRATPDTDCVAPISAQ